MRSIQKRTVRVALIVVALAMAGLTANAQVDRITLQNAAVANGNGTVMPVTGYGAVTVEISGTFTATANFEATIGGTYTAVLGTNLASGAQSTTSAAAGIFVVVLPNADSFRVRISGYVSGSLTAIARGHATGAGIVAGSITVGGPTAQNAAPTGNPEQIAGYSWTDGSNPTATTAGNVTRLLTTTDGRLVTTNDHPKRFRCTVDVSTATTLQAFGGSCVAPGAGLSLYITDVLFTSSVAGGVAADASPTIKSGTGGTCGTGTTTILSAMITANGNIVWNLSTPIKVAANSEICWIMSTAGTKTVVLTGFIAP